MECINFPGLWLLFSHFLTSCGESDYAGDPLLCSFLDVQNLSNYSMVLRFESHNPLAEYSVILKSAETKEIYFECRFGTNPEFALLPSEILNTFEVTTNIDGMDVVVFLGVVDSEWQKSIFQNRHARYILVLNDENISVLSIDFLPNG